MAAIFSLTEMKDFQTENLVNLVLAGNECLPEVDLFISSALLLINRIINFRWYDFLIICELHVRIRYKQITCNDCFAR